MEAAQNTCTARPRRGRFAAREGGAKNPPRRSRGDGGSGNLLNSSVFLEHDVVSAARPMDTVHGAGGAHDVMLKENTAIK